MPKHKILLVAVKVCIRMEKFFTKWKHVRKRDFPTLGLLKILPRDNLLPCRQQKATGLIVTAATFISTKQIKKRNCDLVLINTRLLGRESLGALEHILASHHLNNLKIYHRDGRKYSNCNSVECSESAHFWSWSKPPPAKTVSKWYPGAELDMDKDTDQGELLEHFTLLEKIS